MANLPVVIFQFAPQSLQGLMQQLAWSGARLITFMRFWLLSVIARLIVSALPGGKGAPMSAVGTASDYTRARCDSRCCRRNLSQRELNFSITGKTRALTDINLSFADRSITALIGPSGCGKSTLLRVFNRMYALYPGHRATGEVRLDGENILAPTVDVASLRYRVGMVFQKPTPFPMTIFDNVAFGLRLAQRIPRARAAERVEAALRDAAMWEEVKDKLGEDARSLSGGQQQRLCIARTIAVEPEVMLFDEPTAALDPISTLRIEEMLPDSAREILHHHRHAQSAQPRPRASPTSRRLACTWANWWRSGRRVRSFTSPRNRRTDDYVTGRFG